MPSTQTSAAIQQALDNIRPDIMDALRAARGPKDALAKFQDTPEWWILFNAVQQFLAAVNTQIPRIFTQQEVNLFGLSNNHLDPLNFNGQVRADASGEYCTPQDCHDVFGVEICLPPFSICAEGRANASLDGLTGLSTMLITNFGINDAAVNGNKISTTGSITSYLPQLSAHGQAGASGGPSGFSIPISGSGSATITGMVINADITIACNLSPPKVTALTIDRLTIGGNDMSLNIDIDGLGPFNNLLNGLRFVILMGLAGGLGLMNSTDQSFPAAIKGALQSAINSQL